MDGNDDAQTKSAATIERENETDDRKIEWNRIEDEYKRMKKPKPTIEWWKDNERRWT